jgi:hypothetical protein
LHIGEKYLRTNSEQTLTHPEANPMPLNDLFSAAILETVLIRLAALFLAGAGGDSTAARQAALQTLGAYHPETEDELRLAANVIGFGPHAL